MRLLKYKLARIIPIALFLAILPFGAQSAFADNQCGKGDGSVKTAIDFGCVGDKCQGSAQTCTAVVDLMFAAIRFLSTGVGLVIVGSLVWAGVQYSASKGDPQASEAAQNRIQSTLIALLIFIFAWAIINYIVPHGVLKL